MKQRPKLPWLVLAALASGCGPGPELPDPCASLQPGDACFSDEALEQCLDAVERCGADQVLILESCPPQFQCPGD